MSISSSLDIALRFAVAEDAKAIQDIAFENFEKVFSKYYTQSNVEQYKMRWSMDNMKAILQEQVEGRRIILLAEDKNKNVIGMAGLVNSDIRMVLIKPENHNQGCGRALIARIEEIAKSKGISQLTVTSTVQSEGFYHKLGFITLDKESDPKLGRRINMKKAI